MAFVPSVIGETVASASEILEGAGFGISVVYTTDGATSGNDGTAKSQSPGAGTDQPLFTVVTVTFYQFSAPPPFFPPSFPPFFVSPPTWSTKRFLDLLLKMWLTPMEYRQATLRLILYSLALCHQVSP